MTQSPSPRRELAADTMSHAAATTDATSAPETAHAARLFDIRRTIGWLFVVYGLLVTGAGVVDGADAEAKAGGLDLNLWTGLAMLVLGGTFLAWMRLRPLVVEAPEADETPRAPVPPD